MPREARAYAAMSFRRSSYGSNTRVQTVRTINIMFAWNRRGGLALGPRLAAGLGLAVNFGRIPNKHGSWDPTCKNDLTYQLPQTTLFGFFIGSKKVLEFRHVLRYLHST